MRVGLLLFVVCSCTPYRVPSGLQEGGCEAGKKVLRISKRSFFGVLFLLFKIKVQVIVIVSLYIFVHISDR